MGALRTRQWSQWQKVEIGMEFLQCIGKFCYLRVMIGGGGGAEGSFIARIRNGWKKFRDNPIFKNERVLSAHERWTVHIMYEK